jgi:phage recombination protein Bet
MRSGGALAIRPDQIEWTPEQSAVLQQSGIDNDVTSAELSGFLHLCQRTQLDPFSRQIYLIGRWDSRSSRKVFTPQTGIDGYRVVAHRVIAATSETLGYEDTLWCGEDGRWRDVWLAAEPPAAAKVTVLRGGHRFSAVALYREYVQTNRDNRPIGLWGRMPAGQLAKCGEALALRKAFPHDLAGVYTAEEMAQADNPAAEDGATPIRRLRQVQSEPDPWASDTPPRDWLAEAEAAADTAAVRALWVEARGAGVVPDVLGRMAQIGREKAAAGAEPVDAEIVDSALDPTEGPTPSSGTAAAGAMAAAAAPGSRETALDDLRAAALAAGMAATLDADFVQSYGVDTAAATIEQLAEATALLRGAA